MNTPKSWRYSRANSPWQASSYSLANLISGSLVSLINSPSSNQKSGNTFRFLFRPRRLKDNSKTSVCSADRIPIVPRKLCSKFFSCRWNGLLEINRRNNTSKYAISTLELLQSTLANSAPSSQNSTTSSRLTISPALNSKTQSPSLRVL